MTDQVVEQGEIQDEDAALASAMAGYDGARGATPPADRADQSTPTAAETPTAIEPTTPPEPTEAQRLAAELQQLKSQVSAIRSTADPDAVRRLHGEIGNINRTLKQLQSASPTQVAEAEDELANALKDAEKVAAEFEEFGTPMVRALKAIAARNVGQKEALPAEQIAEQIEARVSQRVMQIKQKEAVEAVSEEHPDWAELRQRKEFGEWLQSKPPEYQQKLMNSWNSAVIARGLAEAKDWIKARERKQTRLAGAVTPQGTSQAARPSVIPDEDAAFIGYNKGPKRLNQLSQRK